MAGKKVKQKRNIERWLLGFERLAGQPVVLSILVEQGKCEFLSCITKHSYDEIEEADSEEPKISLQKLNLKGLQQASQDIVKKYIG